MMRRLLPLILSLGVLSAAWGQTTRIPEPAAGPADEVAQHVRKLLADRSRADGQTWSFAVAADTHVQYYDSTHNEKFAELLKSWIDAKVDFATIVGDLGGPGHDEPFGRQLARTTGCPPILVAMGNHEMDRGGKRAWLNALYPGVVKGEGQRNDRLFYYSVDYRGCHFVFLDGDHIVGRQWFGDQISADQVAWLAKDLEANRGKTTFVFSHQPIECSQQGKGAYLMVNRARVVAVLRRFPDVKWVFMGHVHYDEPVRVWGINFVHVFRQPLAVRVTGQKAELCRITPKGLAPLADEEWNELGRRMEQRQSREGGREVLHVAEQTVEKEDVHARHGVEADGLVRPTFGKTMLKVTRAVAPGAKDAGQPLQIVLANTEFITIVKGMTFSYDVRLDGEADDEFALHLHVGGPEGDRTVELVDQDGLAMQATKTGRWTYRAPAMKGRATGKWHTRRCDLSGLAGCWIDRITLVAGAVRPAEGKPATQKVYVDDIRFTWPVSDPESPDRAASGE